MNRDSNVYTFTFATLMVFVVASVLAYTSFSLKDLQNENVRKEKMQNILSTVGIQTDREGAEKLFNTYIVEQLALRNNGTVDADVDADVVDSMLLFRTGNDALLKIIDHLRC